MDTECTQGDYFSIAVVQAAATMERPEYGDRLQKAMDLVLTGNVVQNADGTATVKSGSHTYQIDPQAKAIAVQGLKLARMEIRYVSVLMRQPNGTYKYESRRKEAIVRVRLLPGGVHSDFCQNTASSSTGCRSARMPDASK